jgi:3-deoxy-D-manno-octulosonic-acid transferase
MYFLYSILTALAMILVGPYFIVQGLRTGKSLHNIRERMGSLRLPLPPRASGAPNAIWIHAVSVGEVLATIALAQRLKQTFPQRPLYISTTTDTGQRMARERLPLADGIFYFPFDWAWIVRRVLRALDPGIVIIMETEIWPNFLREARRRGVPVVFANARISPRSMVRYARVNRYYNNFIACALGHAAGFLAQTEEDAQRLRELGAVEEIVEVAGNMKYDIEPPALGELGKWLAEQLQQQERWPVIVAGSVVEDEEEPVLAAFDPVQRQWRHALLILAPRKPERFAMAGEIAIERGWKIARRSLLDLSGTFDEDADVLTLDSIGELAGLYGLADAVFVGGSLVAAGGHNILEPAWFGKPPVFGPHMENFREMAAQFVMAGAGAQVSNAEKLGRFWIRLIQDAPAREKMGQAARNLVVSNRGATDCCYRRIVDILQASGERV